VKGHRRHSDTSIVAYYTAVAYHGAAPHSPAAASRGLDARRDAAIVRCCHSSSQLISDTVDGASSTAIGLVVRGAAANPNTDRQLIEAFLEHPDVGHIAAGNAGLDAGQVNTWYANRSFLLSDAVRGSDTHRGLLSNPHIAREHLAEAVRDQDRNDDYMFVALNDAAPGDLLAEIVRRCPDAYSHRNCPDDVVRAGLESNSAIERRAAAANPRHDAGALDAILDAEQRRRAANAGVLAAISDGMQRLELRANPGRIHVAALHATPIVERLADVLDAGGDHADAVVALIRSGFDGTVDDLIGVASGLVVA
jgi:hypothetical protein